MTYKLDKVYQHSCDHGFIAIKYSDADGSSAWVSDTFYSLELFQRANVTSLDAPMLYRWAETNRSIEGITFGVVHSRTHNLKRINERNRFHLTTA